MLQDLVTKIEAEFFWKQTCDLLMLNWRRSTADITYNPVTLLRGPEEMENLRSTIERNFVAQGNCVIVMFDNYPKVKPDFHLLEKLLHRKPESAIVIITSDARVVLRTERPLFVLQETPSTHLAVMTRSAYHARCSV